MNRHKDALDGKPQGTDETRAATVISTPIITPAADNPIANEIRWMETFAQALDTCTLAAWALRLQGVNPAENRRAYLWRELARIELRRRRRNIHVLDLDRCPLCGIVGRWWRNRGTGGIRCLACGADGGAL